MEKRTLIKFNIGDRFGRLVIKSMTTLKAECLCDCGLILVTFKCSLRQGRTKSCGCYQKECAKKQFTKHGQHDSPTYRSWNHMLERCRNPKNDRYEMYGGRGITVCERWQSFENFVLDMGQRPYKTSIDRIDVNGGYCKDNCRWSNSKEQSNNKRKRFAWIIDNVEYEDLSSASKVFKVSRQTIKNWCDGTHPKEGCSFIKFF